MRFKYVCGLSEIDENRSVNQNIECTLWLFSIAFHSFLKKMNGRNGRNGLQQPDGKPHLKMWTLWKHLEMMIPADRPFGKGNLRPGSVWYYHPERYEALYQIKTGWWFGCHEFYFPIWLGFLSSSQLTKSYFSEGWPWPTNQKIWIDKVQEEWLGGSSRWCPRQIEQLCSIKVVDLVGPTS